MKKIDLRSDTVTQPTDEMREAMKNAEVGDDAYGDDPTAKKLEERAAARLGKEAALFVPSGIFGNQLALFTHCNRGDEVILGDDCHIVAHEVGAASVIAGVQLRTVNSDRGKLSKDEIGRKIRRGNDIHFPKTGLICLENAYSNGRVIPLAWMAGVYAMARENGVPLHLDGARIFNAAVALGVDAGEIAAQADSVMFCLSKGLCAPVGSILAGEAAFIEKAKKRRKLMGGELRQAGVLAAPGLLALEKMPERLHEDHENASFMGSELAKVPGIRVLADDIQINMVFFDMRGTGYQSERLVTALLAHDIIVNSEEAGLMRFVTHHGVTKEDIEYVIETMKNILATQ